LLGEQSPISQDERRRSDDLFDGTLIDYLLRARSAGDITYLNPVAESMTGWSAQEACGQPLQDVLRMIDGNSREPPERASACVSTAR